MDWLHDLQSNHDRSDENRLLHVFGYQTKLVEHCSPHGPGVILRHISFQTFDDGMAWWGRRNVRWICRPKPVKAPNITTWLIRSKHYWRRHSLLKKLNAVIPFTAIPRKESVNVHSHINTGSTYCGREGIQLGRYCMPWGTYSTFTALLTVLAGTLEAWSEVILAFFTHKQSAYFASTLASTSTSALRLRGNSLKLIFIK